MNKLEKFYRRFFKYPASVSSSSIWFCIFIWIILIQLLILAIIHLIYKIS